MNKEIFEQTCESLLWRYCEVRFDKGKSYKGFIAVRNDDPASKAKGLYELSMGNMRITLLASKIRWIREIERNNKE